jgi:RNA polymerase sporulation-specific sigma factor
MRDLAYRSLSAREEISKKTQRDATVPEIAAALGEDEKAVARAMEAIVEPVSLYDSVYSDGEDSVYVIDQLRDQDVSDEAWIENIALKEALERLGERERDIIKMRFYRGKTQMEIAEEIGISQAQVSRLEKSAIEHIREKM